MGIRKKPNLSSRKSAKDRPSPAAVDPPKDGLGPDLQAIDLLPDLLEIEMQKSRRFSCGAVSRTVGNAVGTVHAIRRAEI
jgi:hypothetical protein